MGVVRLTPMKYELETIPIWDAYELDTECPLCILEEKAEQRYIDFFLGNSVMVPEMRVEVNKTGFCPAHFEKLFVSEKNRHGLGLVAHTHMKDIMGSLQRRNKKLRSGGSSAAGNGGLFGGLLGGTLKKNAAEYCAHLREREQSCMICDRLDYTLKRYAFTIVYLWQKKADFRERFNTSKGFCLHHLPCVLDMAAECMGGRKYAGFVSETIGLLDSSLLRLEQELHWFTQKFDHQNAEKPWGTSKDALHRALQKLTGLIVRSKKVAS